MVWFSLTKGFDMNDVFTIGTIAGVVGVALISYLGFHAVYGGPKGSLHTAKVGEVYNFDYLQPMAGDPERYLAKVLEVHTLSNDSIRRLNATSRYRKSDPQFHRTSHLVTCVTPDGKTRNFYAERTMNCRKPLLAKALFGTKFAAALV